MYLFRSVFPFLRIRHRTILYLFLLVFQLPSLKGQVGGIYYGDLIKQGDSRVELWLFPPKKSCGPDAGSWNFKLRTENLDKLDSTKKYLSWKINTTNCDGFLIKQGFRVSIESIRAKSSFLKGNSDWFFDARQVEGYAYDVKLSESSRRSASTASEPMLFPPDSISGPRLVTSDMRVTLRVMAPSLPEGAEWVWYRDSCSLNPVFRGSVFVTQPQKTTTYYVRSEWKDLASPCKSISVSVDDISMPPDRITSSASKICEGDDRSVTLSISGGRLGYKALWVWYANELSTASRIAAGVSQVEVKPGATTAYYVRAEGPKGNSAPVAFSLPVMRPSLPPDNIVRQPDGLLCEGTPLNLSIEGGRLGDESYWVWSSISQDGSKQILGKGSIIRTKLDQPTVFMAYGEGPCGRTKEVYLDLEVKRQSVNPQMNAINSALLKKGKRIRTTFMGGSLGDGGRWMWYADSAGLQKMAEGNEILSRPGKNESLYLRAEGDCNQTALIRHVLPAQKFAKDYFLAAGWITNTFRPDSSNLSNFFIAAGIRRFYMKFGFGWPELSGNEGGDMQPSVWNSGGERLVDFPSGSGTNYAFTGKLYPRIQAYTAGFMLFKRQLGRTQLNFSLGGGYGSYDLFREYKLFNSPDGTLKGIYWAKDISKSLQGPSAEAGLLVKWKWVSMMGGVNTIFSPTRGQQFMNGYFGVGFAF